LLKYEPGGDQSRRQCQQYAAGGWHTPDRPHQGGDDNEDRKCDEVFEGERNRFTVGAMPADRLTRRRQLRSGEDLTRCAPRGPPRHDPCLTDLPAFPVCRMPSGAGSGLKVARQIRSTMALTIPVQSSRAPQTNAIGPNPLATLPAIRTSPMTTNAAAMIQKNRECLIVTSLSSPPRVSSRS